MLLKLLTSRIFWGTLGIIGLGLFINNWVNRIEDSITSKIEDEMKLVAKDEQIKALEDRLNFIASEQADTKAILMVLENKNQEVKVITNEITKEIIEKAVPQPIAPLSPVIADTSEALAKDWENTYGEPK
jgi:DNA polymerase III delta prime subunit